jgi:sigma-B regulation protein RsbU (phosphoserine phosphatase)
VPGNEEVLTPISSEVSPDELWGWLVAVRQFRPRLRRLSDQVVSMQRLGRKVNENLMEVDQELRLASRLQRDFLPRSFPEVCDLRFAASFRPATWVSGDIYDVRRLDEHHFGFFVADAMGHGVAAGLLTMFIKEAIVGRRVQENEDAILPPGEILADLNNELAAQQLPNCQFTTACYGWIDVRTHQLVFARGGHPHPIHVDPEGRCREVETPGGLLGVFPDGEFPSESIILEPGDKLLLYSDGLEEVVVPGRDESGKARFTSVFLEAMRLHAQECLDYLARHLDGLEGSLQPSDDQTCLVIERLPR